jgi:hypothetical protein
MLVWLAAAVLVLLLSLGVGYMIIWHDERKRRQLFEQRRKRLCLWLVKTPRKCEQHLLHPKNQEGEG